MRLNASKGAPLNPTIINFGYPDSLVCEFEHWLVLLRPAQVTLGSLVMAAKSDAAAYSQLPPDAFAEQALVVAAIERALTDFCAFEKINYLMLMMVDREVHFHVIPRYSGSRTFEGVDFPDRGWPKTPDLASAIELTPEQSQRIRERLMTSFANL
jgi:diadenosine tetraphosphate (Ap4A) HIT family hydrolase